MEKSAIKLTSATVLFIRIPGQQVQRHVVEVTGSFQSGEGVEVHVQNPYRAQISRIRELTISDTRFRFEALNLNQTGYDFYIWLNNTNYTVVEATPMTFFEVKNLGFVAAEKPTFNPMFGKQ